ncbi:MAG: archease [Thermoplasmatota archaeon]
MSYEYIEHTADIGVKARGDDLEEAFRETAKGMFSIITEIEKVEQIGEYRIELKENNWEDLLISFLSELIYIHEVEDLLFCDFEVKLRENDEKEMITLAKGEKIDLNKHNLETAVKGVSYHDISVDPDGEIKVIFDV